MDERTFKEIRKTRNELRIFSWFFTFMLLIYLGILPQCEDSQELALKKCTEMGGMPITRRNLWGKWSYYGDCVGGRPNDTHKP